MNFLKIPSHTLWIVVILFLNGCGGHHLVEVSDQEFVASQSLRMWSHDFSNRISKMEALPGAHLAVSTVSSGKGKGNLPKLHLLDGQSGKILWSGMEEGTNVIAGNPIPIVVKQSGKSLALKGINRKGETVWHKDLDVTSLSIGVDMESKEMLILGTSSKWWSGARKQDGVLTVLSLAKGSIKWQVNLGELYLPVVVPPTVMKLTPKSVWIAVGGRVIRISRESRKIAFNHSLKETLGKESSPILKWDARDEIAALALEGSVHMIDASQGILWSAYTKEKDIAPDEVAITDTTVVAGFRIPLKERAKMYVAAFDRNNGAEKWNYQERDGILIKWDRVIAPPLGMAVGKGRVVISIDKKLIALDIDTGKPAYEIDLENYEYYYAKKVSRWRDRVILFGKFQIRAHDLETGDPIWHMKDFGTPKDFAEANQKIGKAVMSAGFSIAASMQEFSAQSMQSLANTKVAGKSGDGYSHYVFSPSSRQQMLSASNMAGQSSAWYKVGQSVADMSSLSKWVDTNSYSDNPDLLVKSIIFDTNIFAFMPFRVGGVGIINLEDGTHKELLPLKAKIGCLTAISIDFASRQAYYVSQKLGLACKSYKKLEAYSLP